MTVHQDSMMAPEKPAGGAATQTDDRMHVPADTDTRKDIASLQRDAAY